MKRYPRIARLLIVGALMLGAARVGSPASPTGEIVIAWHVTIPPAWLDPAEAPVQVSPFEIYYALHDAMVRPLPGEKLGHSLAESWMESPDGLVYEFKLREGLKFHNGDPCTAEDVKFSFERYRGVGAKPLHAHVHTVEVVDALRVRFHLKAPWPDFMTFYGTTASAAGFVLPKRYLEQVGEDGFKHHPIGLGPYQFVRYTPGVEVVLEAYEGHWRQVPSVKRVIMKGVPEGSTRLAMLKRQEADIAFALDGPIAEEVRRDPNLRLVDVRLPSVFWIEFPEQWEPTSVWADKRVRLAVNYALDRQAISEAACLGPVKK
jgi:peptide/nickel transport system substrate-binding protein